jgi:type VI secretion system protein ImpC
MTKPPSFGKLEVTMGATLEEAAGAADSSTPFQIALLGDFSGRASRGIQSPGTIAARRPLVVDRDNFEETLAKLGVEVRLSLEGGPPVTIGFRDLDDFLPDEIFSRVTVFEKLRELRGRLANSETFRAAAEEVQGYAEAEPEAPPQSTSDVPAAPAEPAASTEGLLDQMLEAPPQEDPAAKPSQWDELIRTIVGPYCVPKPDPRQAELIASVDSAVAGLMRTILHHPVFQEVEAAWRALHLLISRLETDSQLKVCVLDVSKAELAADLESSEDLRATQTYRLLVEKTVHTPGGVPWAVLAGNYTFGPTQTDAELLGRMAKIALSAGAPFIAAASPGVVGCESFARTPDPDDWQSAPEPEALEAWRSLRRLPESPSVGLVLPRFLLRLPYGPDAEGTERFDFEEMPGEPDHDGFLWGSPAFSAAYLLARGFLREGGGFRPGIEREIGDLPVHVYKSEGESVVMPCAEALLSDRAAEMIAAKGLMPLVSIMNQGTVRLVRFSSIADPPAPLAGRWG